MFGRKSGNNVVPFAENYNSLNTQFANNLRDLKYRPDGTGRDTYINVDNGGFLNVSNNLREPRRSGAYPPPSSLPTLVTSVSPKQASAVDTMKPLHYRGNGTGRDTYIQHGDGGFTTTRKIVAQDPLVTFKTQLRGYEPDSDYLLRRKFSQI